MRRDLSSSFNLNRRHLVIGALGAAALPLASRALARAIEVPATEEDVAFMRLAIAEAAKGDYPFGAVITSDGEVLAKGRNLTTQEHDPTAHGEMVALRHFLAEYGPEKLKGTTLYTSGEPCAMCMGAIIWCGVGRLVFAASIEQVLTKTIQIAVSSAEIADKSAFATIDLTGGVLAQEAIALFK